MKTLLVLFLALMTVFASAMSIRRPFRKPVTHPAKTTRPVVTRRPVNTTHPVETTRPVEKSNPVSWKTIAAGGAATGTVVGATLRLRWLAPGLVHDILNGGCKDMSLKQLRHGVPEL